jgi:hypothetical protein
MDSSDIEMRRQIWEREDRVNHMEPSEVQKRTLLYELEDHLKKLFLRRAWILGIVGIFGLYILARFVVEQYAATPLKEIEKKYAQAELLADQIGKKYAQAELLADRAKKAASDAQGAADQATTQAAQATTQMSSLTKGVQDLADQIAEGKNAAGRSNLDSQATQQRISRLEALVKNISAENEVTRKAYAHYKKQIDKITAETASNQKRFAENSRYTVLIVSSPEQRPLAEKVQNELADVGFKASLLGLPPVAAPAGAPPGWVPPWPPWGPSTDPGNTLTYTPDNEMKAQEILARIKPILKDVRLESKEPPKIPPPPGQTATVSPPPSYRLPFYITLRS